MKKLQSMKTESSVVEMPSYPKHQFEIHKVMLTHKNKTMQRKNNASYKYNCELTKAATTSAKVLQTTRGRWSTYRPQTLILIHLYEFSPEDIWRKERERYVLIWMFLKQFFFLWRSFAFTKGLAPHGLMIVVYSTCIMQSYLQLFLTWSCFCYLHQFPLHMCSVCLLHLCICSRLCVCKTCPLYFLWWQNSSFEPFSACIFVSLISVCYSYFWVKSCIYITFAFRSPYTCETFYAIMTSLLQRILFRGQLQTTILHILIYL